MSKDLTDALRALSQPEGYAAPPAPAPLKTRGGAPAQKSAALNGGKSADGNGGNGGIASPLVETAYTAREFHTETTITSTDGLFTLRIKPVKKVMMKDALNTDVVLEFKAP